MTTWPFAPAGVRAAGPRSALGRVTTWLGRLSRAAILSGLRLFVRFVLIVASLAAAVAGVFVLAGLGWSLLAGAVAGLILEWIIRDGPASGGRHG